MSVPWKAVLFVILLLISDVIIYWFAIRPRVGIDWAHHRFMLPPEVEVPIIPPPPPGAGDIWYEAPTQKRWIKG